MRIAVAAIAAFMFSPASAEESAFKTGPVIEAFGPHAPVLGAAAIPAGAVFKISFDTREKAADGEANRTLVSAARFINMHGAAGVDPESIELAVVIHGQAVKDVTADAAANAPLIAALRDQNVRIIVCGQSAAYYGVAADDLAPGVEMALSAMTAHAQLQGAGYSLNPF